MEKLAVYLEALVFLDKVEAEIGEKSFDRNKVYIHLTMMEICKTWKSREKDPIELLKSETLLQMITEGCRSRDASRILLGAEE